MQYSVYLIRSPIGRNTNHLLAADPASSVNRYLHKLFESCTVAAVYFNYCISITPISYSTVLVPFYIYRFRYAVTVQQRAHCFKHTAALFLSCRSFSILQTTAAPEQSIFKSRNHSVFLLFQSCRFPSFWNISHDPTYQPLRIFTAKRFPNKLERYNYSSLRVSQRPFSVRTNAVNIHCSKKADRYMWMVQ